MFTDTTIHPIPATTAHRYEVHGYGGSPAIQARLAKYGQINHITWEPGPPAWRLHYDTALSLSEVEQLLPDLIRRYDLKLYETH